MTANRQLTELITPLLGPLGVELWDLEQAGATLRITVDRPGGIDLDAIAEVTRAVSRALDEADPIAGQYTLEVSSPGVERTLRTPEHYQHSIGATVKIKTVAGYDGQRRLDGELVAADDDGIVVRPEPADGEQPSVRLGYADIERARTVFIWGAPERPSGSQRKAAS